jgi:hypothetical protein
MESPWHQNLERGGDLSRLKQELTDETKLSGRFCLI